MGKQNDRIERELKLINAHPASVKGGKKRRTTRDEVEQELLSITRAPDADDDDEALCGKQVTNFLRKLPPMKRRPAIIEMQQLMFRFEYDAQLVYDTATQQELPPQQEIPPQQQQPGTSASFANSAPDAWATDGAVIDENSMEALNGDPMFSSTASNSN